LAITVIFLFLLLGAIAYMPWVQTFIAEIATVQLSKKLGTTVKVERVHLRFINSADLNGLYIEDFHGDTLLYASKFRVDIKHLLFGSQDFNVKKVFAEIEQVNLIRYADTEKYDYEYMLDSLGMNDPDTTDLEPFNGKVTLQNSFVSLGRFRMEDRHDSSLTTLTVDNARLKLADAFYKSDTLQVELQELSFVLNDTITVNGLSGNFRMNESSMSFDDLRYFMPEAELLGDISVSYPAEKPIWVDYSFSTAQLNITNLLLRPEFFYKFLGEKVEKEMLMTGSIRGNLDSVSLDNFMVSGINNTVVSLSGEASVLTSLKELNFRLNIHELETDSTDIRHFMAFFTTDKVPSEVLSLGQINVTGFLQKEGMKIDSRLEIATQAGYAEVKMASIMDSTYVRSLKGSVATESINLQKILNNNELGMLFSRFDIEATNPFDNQAVWIVDGVIPHVDYNQVAYNNISLEGTLTRQSFDGFFEVNDELLKMTFEGIAEVDDAHSKYSFRMHVNEADLAGMGLVDLDSTFIVSTNIDIDLEGPDLEHTRGEGQIYETTIMTSTNYHFINDFALLMKDSLKNTFISIESDILDGYLYGDFQIVHLPAVIAGFVDQYFAGIPVEKSTEDEELTFQFRFWDISPVTRIFVPELYVEPGTEINGRISTKENRIEAILNTPGVQFGDKRFHQVSIYADNRLDRINLNADIAYIQVGEIVKIPTIRMDNHLQHDTAWVDFKWGVRDSSVRGQIAAYINKPDEETTIWEFFPTKFNHMDTLWNIAGDNYFELKGNRLEVWNFHLYSALESFKLNGVVSENPLDFIELELERFDLSWLNPLIDDPATKLFGETNGKVKLYGLYSDPYAISDLRITDLTLNSELLGDFTIATSWEEEQRGIGITSALLIDGKKTLDIVGAIYPYSETPFGGVRIRLDDLEAYMFSSYTASFMENLRGKINGNMEFKFVKGEPVLLGQLDIKDATFTLPETQVNYMFEGVSTVKFTENEISFSDVKLKDTKHGTKGKARGKINHKNLGKWSLDINIEANNLYSMNTTESDNDSYFGQAYATGTIRIHGPISKMMMRIDAKAEPGTHFYLPLYSSSEVGENSFVSFVKPDEVSAINRSKGLRDNKTSTFEMIFNLEISPSTVVELIFDPTTGDIIKATGGGNMSVRLTPEYDIIMYGDYTIESGDYLFTLQNLLNKKFILNKGGTIKWDGDPYEAMLDLTASYNLRTNLRPLQISDSSRTKQAIKVDLMMYNKLSAPNISFNISAPNAPAVTQQELNDVLNRDQNELNRQVFSLLIMNSFLTPEYASMGSNPNYVSQGVTANTTEILSNQLSRWVSGISDKFDLGVNYEAGSEYERQQVEVALSTQLFNERVVLNTNIGVPLGSTTSQIVGDMEVEYKASKDGNLRFTAFNRSVQYDPLQSQYTYKQGLGIVYRTSFNTWADLKEKIRKKKEAKANATKEEDEE
jgi:hypothetical protein